MRCSIASLVLPLLLLLLDGALPRAMSSARSPEVWLTLLRALPEWRY